MFQFIPQSELDEDRWNQTVKKYGEGRPFLFTWYLDTVCERWDALIYSDYEYIAPLPRYTFAGVDHCIAPPWVNAMFPIGPQAHIPEKMTELTEELLDKWPKDLRYTRYPGFSPPNDASKSGSRLFQWQCGPESLALRADEKLLPEEDKYSLFKNDPPEALIELIFKNRDQKHSFDSHEKERLKHLMHVGIYKRRGQVWSLYDESNTLAAGAYVMYDAECLTVIHLAGRSGDKVDEARLLLWHVLRESEPYPIRVELFESAAPKGVEKGLYAKEKIIPEFFRNQLPWYLKWHQPKR